ncbi:hypothetical protein [Bacillus haynesii]|uniref:hypothetical protein n=1 Tax=Bacillus haynesii TaxID=1925021 RepID=UPI0022820D2F|nr:hypothetical protein [Bacillus haynesii]MCY9157827.1 EF-hand domain-containing protein [Bacillus haynesii]
MSVPRLKRKLESVIDPDEFVEIAKEIGIENLTEQQQNYYLYTINRKNKNKVESWGASIGALKKE